MFSLARSSQMMRLAGRRFASGAPVGVSHGLPSAKVPFNKALPKAYQYSFKQSWLSDPSTYPLIGAMFVGVALIVGFSANALTRYKGVKISSAQKHAEMPLESAEQAKRTVPLTEFIVNKNRGPTSFHARKYTSIAHEGLGVDHEAWKRAKEQERTTTK